MCPSLHSLSSSDVQQYSDPDPSSWELESSSRSTVSSSSMVPRMAVQAAFTWKESCERRNSTAINQMSRCSQPTYHHENHRDLGEQRVQHGDTLGVSRSHSFPVRRPRLGSATMYLTCMSPCTRLDRRINILRCLRCTRVICMPYLT